MADNSNSEMQPALAQGDWDKWDARWKKTSGSSTLLYTEGVPRNIRQFRQKCYFEDVWNLMPVCDGAPNCLELGSGRATTSTYLASKGCRVTLVDLSLKGLELAKQNFAGCNLPEPEIVVADAQQTGLPAAAYDCVYNIGLLEHFKDPLPVLAESLRLLRPGGLLYSVVIPPLRPWHTWALRAPLNPLGWATDIARLSAKRVLGRQRKQKTQAGIRTDYSRQQWLDWMAELGQPNAQCVSYNPYHDLYRHQSFNSLIAVPLYRLHRCLKRKGQKSIGMHTWSWCSLADLLVCYKE